MKTRSYRKNRKSKTNLQMIEIKRLQKQIHMADLINDLNAETIKKALETNRKLVDHIRETKTLSEKLPYQDTCDSKRDSDRFDALRYAIPHLNGHFQSPNEPIKLKITGDNTRINFNLNSLTEKNVFDLVNDVVNSSINQLINLKKEKSHQAALEEIELTIKEIAKEKDIYKRRVNSLVATLCHSELEKRMKNSPVK